MMRTNIKPNYFSIYRSGARSSLRLDDESGLTGFEIIWITGGNGSLMVNRIKRPVDGRSIFFLAPGSSRRLQLQPGSECLTIRFSLEFSGLAGIRDNGLVLQDHYGDSFARSTLSIERDILLEMEELREKMTREFHRYGLSRPEILRGQLRLFLVYFFRDMVRGGKTQLIGKKGELVNQFFCLLKKEYKVKRTVTEYADALCMTPNYFSQIVKNVSGFPARHHIEQYIVNEAKNLALYSNLSFKEIAYELGFSDYAHFSKFFKKAVGVSFTIFKKAGAGQFENNYEEQ
jgi:AraC family transcriptional activator of pobA